MALRKKKKREDVFFSFFLFIIIIASFLPLLDVANKISFLADEFRFQYFLLSTIVFLITLFKKRFKTASLFLVLAVLNIAIIASHIDFFKEHAISTSEQTSLNFMLHRVSNKNFGNDDMILNNIKNQKQDLAFIIDASDDLTQNLEESKKQYPFINKTLCSKASNCLILSRFEPKEQGKIYLENNNTFMWNSYLLQNKLFTIVLFNEGTFGKDYVSKNKNLASLIDFIKSRDEPVILAGGFSSSPWVKRFKPLETEAGLFPNGGLRPNWPSVLPFPLRLPLDHFYVHPGISISPLKIETAAGSDYRSLTGKIFIAK